MLRSGFTGLEIIHASISSSHADMIGSQSTLLVHGCIPLLESPTKCRSYLVEPKLPSQDVTERAVGLLAVSEGVG